MKKGIEVIPVGERIRRDWLKGVPSPKTAQILALGVLGFFIVLSAFGVTTSSMGIGLLTEDAGPDAGVVAGQPRGIRSDEYIRITPWRVGTLTGSAEDFKTPLTHDPFYALVATPNNGIAEFVVYLDAAAVDYLGPFLPDAFLFSLFWWLTTIIVVLALPRWLQMLGVRAKISWLAALLVALSPAVAWWSMWSLRPLAWALLASLLLVYAVDRACTRDRLGVWPIVVAAVSGIFLAKTALAYFPWALPLGAAVLLPTLPFLLARDHLRRRMLLLAIAAGVGLLAVAMVFLENWDAFVALANTVYPGDRRVTGAAVNPGIVYGAQHLGILRQDPAIVGTSQSELATAYTILIVPTVVLLVAMSRSAWKFMHTQATAGALIAVLVVSFVWMSVNIPPSIGAAIPGMNRVDPVRLAQIVGIPVVLLFAVALDRFSRFPRTRIPRTVTVLVASTLTIVVSAWSGVLLKSNYIPDLRLRSIVLVSLVLGVLVGLAIAWPDRSSALAGLAVGAAAVVVLANPVMVGFGQLTNGDAAEFLRLESERSTFTRWATDNASSDALLMANAIPSLSGQQWIGAEEGWIVLDPDRQYVEVWNRGVSSIFMVPTVGLPAPELESPYPDVIVVRVDPCDPALDVFDVTHMIASAPVESQCLFGIGSFDYGGASRFAYQRTPLQG